MARRRRTDRFLRELRERKYRLRGKTTRFIPDADREFARMARLFAGHIAAHADRFGVPAEKVAELTGRVAAFRDALSRSTRRDTAGPMATFEKNETRKEAEKVIRATARFVRGVAEDSLTGVDRMYLNLPERKKRLRRIECPQIAPMLKFIGSTDPYGSSDHGGKHILEYGNDFDLSSSAKPRGAARLELFVELVQVGEPIPAHPGQRSGGRLWYLRSFTTSRFEVEFPMMADGTPMLVCYWGRWADSSGGVGPFSRTCVARVEGGAEQYALPVAQRNRALVMEVFAEIEAKSVMIQSRALPRLPEHAGARLPDSRLLPAVQDDVRAESLLR